MIKAIAKDAFDPLVFLAKVGVGKKVAKYRKNQVIYNQGEHAETIFFIQKGSIKVTVISKEGKEAAVGILEAGQFFGEGCLNGHLLRIATTTATDECTITEITKAAMLATLHNEPSFPSYSWPIY